MVLQCSMVYTKLYAVVYTKLFLFQLKLNELDSVAHKLDITVGTHGAQTVPEVRGNTSIYIAENFGFMI